VPSLRRRKSSHLSDDEPPLMMLAVFFLATTAVALAPLTLSPKEQLRDFFGGTVDSVFVDPQTKEALVATPRFVTGFSTTYSNPTTGATYARNDAYLDLVSPRTAPSLERLRDDLLKYAARPTDVVQVQTFRSPITAFLYERGWRDSFTRNGFPGPDEEFAEFRTFSLEPLFDDDDDDDDDQRTTGKEEGVVLDLSCGTGLFARRIFKALDDKNFRLIAADYSEAMLRETKRRFLLEEETTTLPELVRADVAALPFADASIDAVHCGAALHCYPRLEEGLGEVHRVLKDDGTFFATTFLTGALGTSAASGGLPFRRSSGFRLFSVDELTTLMRDAGFQQVDVRKEGSFCAVIKCTKKTPSSSSSEEEENEAFAPQPASPKED